MIDHIDQRICLIGDGSVSIPLLWCKVPLWVFTLLGSQLTAGWWQLHTSAGDRGLAVTAMNISECPQPPQARPLYGVTSPLDVLHAGPDEGAASGHQERLAVAAAWQQGTLATCIDVRYIETCQQPFIDASNMSATLSSI